MNSDWKFTVDIFVYKTSSISPMYYKSKQSKQMAWDDAVSPNNNLTEIWNFSDYPFEML